MDLVSVIVPVYNVEKYLRECLDSIVNQTYKKLEIILIDDGSTDNSGKICDEYAEWVNSIENEMCIKVVHKRNGGVSDSRNVGLEIATGTWLFFVDSDDYISLNVIEIFVKLAKDNNADFICGRLETVSNGGAVKVIKNYDVEIVNEGINIVRAYVLTDSKVYITSSANAKLYKTSLYGDIRFPLDMNSEDAVYVAGALPRSNKMVFVNENVYSYRDCREGKLSKTPDYFKHISDGINSSDFCTSKFAEHGGEFKHLSEIYRAKSYMELAWMFSVVNHTKDVKGIIKEYRKRVFGEVVRAVFYKEIKFVTKIKLISAIISPVFYRKMIALYAKFKN